MGLSLAKKPTNPDFQGLCERRNFIVHDVALTAFQLGNGRLIHTNPRSGEPAAQVILRYSWFQRQSRFPNTMPNDVFEFRDAGFLHRPQSYRKSCLELFA